MILARLSLPLASNPMSKIHEAARKPLSDHELVAVIFVVLRNYWQVPFPTPRAAQTVTLMLPEDPTLDDVANATLWFVESHYGRHPDRVWVRKSLETLRTTVKYLVRIPATDLVPQEELVSHDN